MRRSPLAGATARRLWTVLALAATPLAAQSLTTPPLDAPAPAAAPPFASAPDRALTTHALGLDVIIDPRLVALPAPSDSGGRRGGDLGAASYGWCRAGGAARRGAQAGAAAVFVGANLGLYEYFRRAWWSGERSDFYVNWDWDVPFRNQDKLGHLHGGYILAEAGREVLEAACVSEKKAAVYGALYAAAFQLQIEIWDGTQRMYGFSPPDLLFNSIGQGISLAHTFVPVTKAVTPTFSYARTAALKATDAGTIPGDLRPSVDYSGQTYWLSVDVDTLLSGRAKRWWPDLLRFSLGHTITDWVDPATGTQFRARRRIMLSLDIDPLKLPGRAPWWMATKKMLRHYRFPAPAIEIMSTGVRGVAWHR
jgi:uncharacterized protein YfiM (DUF2279 family)